MERRNDETSTKLSRPRTFVLWHTPLAELLDDASPPVTGDSVLYFRALQATDCDLCAQLRDGGVDVVWAEDLLTRDDDDMLDQRLDRIYHDWYRNDDLDVSEFDGMSLGKILASEIHRAYVLGYALRCGLQLTRFLNRTQPPAALITDATDGRYAELDASMLLGAIPLASMVSLVANARSIPVIPREAARPLPSRLISGSALESTAMDAGKTMARSSGAWGSWIRALVNRFRPRAYFYLGANLTDAVVALEQRGLDVFTNTTVGIGPLSASWLPTPRCVAGDAALNRLRNWVMTSRTHNFDGLVTIEGTNYAALLSRILDHLVGEPAQLALAQAIRFRLLFSILKPKVVIVAAEEPPHYQTAIQAACAVGAKVFHVDHGYVFVSYKMPSLSRCDSQITYLVHSAEVAQLHGSPQSGIPRPRTEVVPHPAGCVTPGAKPRARGAQQPSVLLTNHDPVVTMSLRRVAKGDCYLLDVLWVAAQLIERGIRVTYRPHPGDDRKAIAELLASIATACGVELDAPGPFFESLQHHDVLVGNVSTVVYQALNAGWPSVFHEPVLDPRDFVGLPAQTEQWAPVSANRETLLALVLDALAGGRTARYADDFATSHATGLIGANSADATARIADLVNAAAKSGATVPSRKVHANAG